MYAASLRFDPPAPRARIGDGALSRARGRAEVAFEQSGGRTKLKHLYQQSPCRVLFPGADDAVPQAVLLNTAGGIAGGDRLAVDIAVGPGAGALITTQAAEKVYRALDTNSAVEATLSVGEGGWLEWLPQETILFDGARLRRRTSAHLRADARLLASEMLVFGRTASGERFRRGLLHDRWRLYRDGRLMWADGLHLAGDIEAITARRATFDGATSIGTVLYAGPDAGCWLGEARRLLSGLDFRAAATCLGDLLLCRFLSRDAFALRGGVAFFLSRFRAMVAGLPARLPRVWAC